MASHPDTRALVLGGGGSTGNAWLIGVVAGLAAAGVDVTAADVTVGTSAGATAAVQLATTDPAELYAAALVPPPDTARPSAGAGAPAAAHLERLRAVIAASSDPADLRRRLGAAALTLDDDATWSSRWRATVAARLPSAHWPTRSVRLTAVDARSGEPVVFDRTSGIAVVDAVAASCASGRPYHLGDARYLDGGYRRNENADLAAGCGRVLVLSPFGGRTLHPPAWGTGLATQVEELRAAGSRVEVVVPDAASEHLFGANAMDLAARPAAARAGHDLGVALAGRLGRFWNRVRPARSATHGAGSPPAAATGSPR